MSPFVAFLHHLAAFTLVAALVIELVLTKDDIVVKTARRIVLADVAFGISAGIVLVLGLLRAVYFEEGPSYYFHSAFCGKAVALLNGRVAVDLSNNGVLVLERP